MLGLGEGNKARWEVSGLLMQVESQIKRTFEKRRWI